MNHREMIYAAIREHNAQERVDFMAATNTTWLGLDGPVFAFADTRARAWFIGSDGRYWADGSLLIESLNHRDTLTEAYTQALCDPDGEARDLWVFTDTRGKWNAMLAPVDEIARLLQLPAPILMPPGNWSRSWWAFPHRTDEQEIWWIANGGKPMDTYLIGDQL